MATMKGRDTASRMHSPPAQSGRFDRFCRVITTPRFGARTTWAFFAVLIVLIVVRAPQLLTAPRFWAEEGTYYFSAAFHSSLFEGLTYVTKGTAGYFVLSATLPATIAAKLVPLEYAPFVTTYFSLAILLVPLTIILWGRSYIWNTALHKVLACLIVLFAPTSVGEVWLNSINAQIYCGLIALCILCEDFREGSTRRMVGYGSLLLFCGLSGIYTSFLFFGFLFKLWLERSRGAWICLAINTGTTVVQGLVFLQLLRNDEIHESKFVEIEWIRSAGHTAYGHFIAPVVGREFSRQVAHQLGLDSVLSGRDPSPWLPLYGLLALAAIVGILLLVADLRARSKRNLLVVSLVSLSILTTLSSQFGVAGGRYGVLPGITLLLLILANLRWKERQSLVRPLACSAILLVSLTVGAEGYRRDPAFTCIAACPSWPEEVTKWRSDPRYMPAIWPPMYPPTSPQWRVRLIPLSHRNVTPRLGGPTKKENAATAGG